MKQIEIGGKTLELVLGDIARQSADMIGNAANAALAGGGGVDGAIHRAAGPDVMAETERRYPDGCQTGSAVVTDAGRLNAKFIVHAVAPIYGQDPVRQSSLLASAYRSCLELAEKHNCQSLALPSLGTGAYGYPFEEAARIAVRIAADYLVKNDLPRVVRFVLFDETAMGYFETALAELKQADGMTDDN